MAERDQRSASQFPSWSPSGAAEVEQPEILPDTHVSAGRLHETHGRLARAAQQYRLALGLRPDHVEAHNRLGVVLDQLGRFKEADEAFMRAIELAGDQAYLRNNLAFSYVMQSRWKEAEAQLLRALEIHPEFTRARVNLGMVLAQQERFDEALRQFEFALPPADACYNMGLMYQSKRRLTEAARAFKSALELDPQMVAAQKRLEKLPPDMVSAANTQTIETASPVPTQAGPACASTESVRPSIQPAANEPGHDHKLQPGDEPNPDHEPDPVLPMPQRLSMWIEADWGLTENELDDLSGTSFDCESLWMDPVGPPFEAFEADADLGPAVGAAADSDPAPAGSPSRVRHVVALVRSILEPFQRLLHSPLWPAYEASLESSPPPPSAQLPTETTDAPVRPTPSLSPAP